MVWREYGYGFVLTTRIWERYVLCVIIDRVFDKFLAFFMGKCNISIWETFFISNLNILGIRYTEDCSYYWFIGEILSSNNYFFFIYLCTLIDKVVRF